MRDSFKLIGAGFLTLFIITSCTVSPHSESTGEYIDSSTTTTKVKASLVDGLGAKGFSVKVKTYKDQVQLSGFVDSQGTRQRAGNIVANVEGVKSVRNDIIVTSR